MFTITKPRSGDVDDIKQQLESARILKECCENSEKCRFQLIHCMHMAHATFLSIQEDRLEIRMPSKGGDTQLIPEALCCISFAYGSFYCAFLGYVVAIRRIESDQTNCIITFPKQLNVTNLRRSFRVPIAENSGLKATIVTPQGHKVKVNPCDITEWGMEIEVVAAQDYGLEVGLMVEVELNFRDEVIQRTAEIRRSDESRCGLSFLELTGNDASRQASQLRSVVLSLQQLWLRSRRKN